MGLFIDYLYGYFRSLDFPTRKNGWLVVVAHNTCVRSRSIDILDEGVSSGEDLEQVDGPRFVQRNISGATGWEVNTGRAS